MIKNNKFLFKLKNNERLTSTNRSLVVRVKLARKIPHDQRLQHQTYKVIPEKILHYHWDFYNHANNVHCQHHYDIQQK